MSTEHKCWLIHVIIVFKCDKMYLVSSYWSCDCILLISDYFIDSLLSLSLTNHAYFSSCVAVHHKRARFAKIILVDNLSLNLIYGCLNCLNYNNICQQM